MVEDDSQQIGGYGVFGVAIHDEFPLARFLLLASDVNGFGLLGREAGRTQSSGPRLRSGVYLRTRFWLNSLRYS